jgi:hypothetical protein
MITTPTQIAKDSSLSIECVCCGERLVEQQDHCATCQAPASVSRAAAGRTSRPSFVSVLGASNAGKTVYSGLLLDVLSGGAESFRGTATGAFSVDLQEQVVTALERRTFPEKTPGEADAWKWLHCQISMTEKRKTRHVDLVSPDFAGEAIAMEVSEPGLYPAIEQVVRKSTGLLVLCDSMRVRDAGSGEDLFAMKLATYIAQLHGMATDRTETKSRRRPAVVGPAIGIVFTKGDACPEAIENPASFAMNNTPRLYEYCSRMFPRHAYFAASVTGSSGAVLDSHGYRMRVPFHIQPYGIVEPLHWILAQN